MDKTYTEKDILKMAIQAKAKGVELYLALARKNSNYHVSRLFAELAKDEEKHKLKLNKWLGAISASEEEAYPGDKSLYLKSLVDDNVFDCDASAKKICGSSSTEEDAIKVGITFEKDFMLFLHELKSNASTEGKKIVNELLDDEVNHLKQMFHLREKVDK